MQQYMWHMTLNSIHTVRLIPAQTLVWGIVCSRWFAYCLIIGVLSIQPNFLICVCVWVSACVYVRVCLCVFWPLSHRETPNCAPVASRAQWSRAYMLSGISHTQTRACKHTWMSFIQLGSHVTHTHAHRLTQTSAWIWKWWLGSYPLMYASAAPLCSRKNPSAISPLLSVRLLLDSAGQPTHRHPEDLRHTSALKSCTPTATFW